ncbi:acyl-CoA dehydrogenase [Kiloniella laminariae]|uniref:Acyl-CoA dehydrogenase n=1 Tax=Kiloniella laminariae TaxID=454162 RepID=A0ABT4LP43_9PROT|nr:acyl-CoA dehydrogenase [Kiloniella laminariae]MCZ4282910.1 acyl-CoA dehydrogenase [Kiloniella laminariae]
MDFTFTEEQQLFRNSTRRFLEEQYAFEKRAGVLEQAHGFLESHWQNFAELGWLAMPFAEEYDGLGGSPVETMILMEEMGRNLLTSPYLATVVLGGGIVAEAGSEQQKSALLPQVGSGELKLALAFAEQGGGYDLTQIRLRAIKNDSGYLLDGTKTTVFYSVVADKIIVAARTAGQAGEREGVSLFLIDRDAAGLQSRDYRTQDGGSASDLDFKAVQVPEEALLGREGQGFLPLQRVIAKAAVALCAEAVGVMWAISEQSGDFLRTREQFGQKLGSFQALQHRLVDVYMKCQLGQSLVYDVVCALGQQAGEPFGPELLRKVCAAKYQVGLDARSVGQEGIQFHGAMGMMTELPIGHYYKRITAINSTFGDPRFHLRRYRELMIQDQETVA